jgi:hypothetical protein
LSDICRNLLIAIATTLVLSVPAAATDYTWTGAASSDWFNPANWNPNGVPGSEDSASINGTVNASANVTVSNLTLSGGNLAGSPLVQRHVNYAT